MRVAVFDEWWSTMGGGEMFAGGIAEHLSLTHDVTALSPSPVDANLLDERLNLDLSRVTWRVVPGGKVAVESASADYDLFVNASYASTVASRARYGMYVVHFPIGYDADGCRNAVRDGLNRMARDPDVEVTFSSGFHDVEVFRLGSQAWTAGDASIDVTLPSNATRDVRLVVGRNFPSTLGPREVRLSVDGSHVKTALITPRAVRFASRTEQVQVTRRGPSDGSSIRIGIECETFVPSEFADVDDDRVLGVPIWGVTVGRRPHSLLTRRFPARASLDWLESYDSVVANSDFSRAWTRRRWHLDPPVLYPPVVMRNRLDKSRTILNVGRFFSAERGHSKKQLEMVRAMKEISKLHGLADWTLHLVGGCSERDRPYLEQVRSEAEGLPVVIHIGASGGELSDLYGRASIYWHATGFGEDPNLHPEKFEHFGITTVEAMSAGAVPVVFDAAGQREVVEDGVSGLLWRRLPELIAHTGRLVGNTARREEMANAAAARACHYGSSAFAGRLSELIDEMTAT